MRIGAVEIGPGAALAPMAGVSDAPMRRLCAAHSASFTVSEMVSIAALAMKDKKSLALLRGGGGSAPYGVQLFGHDENLIPAAMETIEEEAFDFIDVNMGCPAPKVCTGGSGSGLLRNPQKAGEFAKMAVKYSRRPVTVKLRIGWDAASLTGLEVAQRCADAGVVLLAVHGRTREEQYTPGVHYDVVAAIKRAVDIPVLYNGDVDSAENAMHAIKETGCDGVMIGRAAMGNPFLFDEVKAALCKETAPPEPTLRERLATMEGQIGAMCSEKGEERAMREARKVAAGYMRGLKGAAALRRCAHELTYFTDLDGLARLAYKYNSGG